MGYLFEACVGNYREAKRAEELGAHRIELCDNLKDGGTTPSFGTVKIAKDNLNIDINVIIRPRAGNFIYNKEEILIMKNDIEICKNIGVNGIVIGMLTKTNEVDVENIKELIGLAKPLSITFHMAFDEIENKENAIEKLCELGVDRILTKGGRENALKNRDEIKRLIEYAANRITILPGGGITKQNYKEFVKCVGAREIHGTKIVGLLDL